MLLEIYFDFKRRFMGDYLLLTWVWCGQAGKYQRRIGDVGIRNTSRLYRKIFFILGEWVHGY